MYQFDMVTIINSLHCIYKHLVENHTLDYLRSKALNMDVRNKEAEKVTYNYVAHLEGLYIINHVHS